MYTSIPVGSGIMFLFTLEIVFRDYLNTFLNKAKTSGASKS
jgi:TRAP-type C4-dicarboxylate transport system permease small subunit